MINVSLIDPSSYMHSSKKSIVVIPMKMGIQFLLYNSMLSRNPNKGKYLDSCFRRNDRQKERNVLEVKDNLS
jgi:hypothetical protein